MSAVYIASDNIVSPLGLTTGDNYAAVKEGRTGIKQHIKPSVSTTPFYASLLNEIPDFENDSQYTRFERLCILSVQNALSNTTIRLGDSETIFILSTTKGNISLLNAENETQVLRSKIALHTTAKTIGAYFNAATTPLVISNACISGVLAILLAKRLLKAGKYKHAVITGADEVSYFILSGFQSLQAVSNEPCKPFDKQRTGINLGEGAATVVLTADENLASGPVKIAVGDGVSTNDANHISGPSRTGLELGYAVAETMTKNNINAQQLSFISAHGTATIFNDEMESKAFEAAHLSNVPLHSLKGHFGHTLGAAGIIESLISIYSLRDGVVLANKNYNNYGVTGHVNISKQLVKSDKTSALKTASGFGGCNAALIYSIAN